MERFLMFGLDPAPRYRLQRSPLAQAFGQVQFSARAKLATLEGVAPVQDLLDPVFPYMRPQQVQQVSLLVGPAGASAAGSQSQQMWQFDDGAGWSLGLSADTATLSVGPQYRDFSEFSERFRSILTALADGAGVTRADRLGVRYVNIAEVPPGDADAWRQWFRPELTGLGCHGDGWRRHPSADEHYSEPTCRPCRRRVESGPTGEIQAIVRHGLVPANTMVPGVLPTQPQGAAYLLDIDLFVEAPQPFEAEELSRQLTMLHDQIDRFFFWALAPDGATYFGRKVTE